MALSFIILLFCLLIDCALLTQGKNISDKYFDSMVVLKYGDLIQFSLIYSQRWITDLPCALSLFLFRHRLLSNNERFVFDNLSSKLTRFQQQVHTSFSTEILQQTMSKENVHLEFNRHQTDQPLHITYRHTCQCCDLLVLEIRVSKPRK